MEMQKRIASQPMMGRPRGGGDRSRGRDEWSSAEHSRAPAPSTRIDAERFTRVLNSRAAGVSWRGKDWVVVSHWVWEYQGSIHSCDDYRLYNMPTAAITTLCKGFYAGIHTSFMHVGHNVLHNVTCRQWAVLGTSLVQPTPRFGPPPGGWGKSQAARLVVAKVLGMVCIIKKATVKY